MDKLLYNELFIRLLAVALAVLIYVQVVSQPGGVVQRAVSTPVEATALSSALAVRAIVPSGVTVVVRGGAGVIQQLRNSEVQAVIDLRQVQAGRRLVDVKVTVPRGVQLVGVTPLQVSVVVEPVIERSVGVVVESVGKVPAGFASGQPTLSQPQVVLRGPSSAVDAVTRVVARVSIGGATAAVSTQATLLPLDTGGRPVPGVLAIPSTVGVTVPVAQVVPTKAVSVVPVLTGGPAKGYTAGKPEVIPATVTVLAPASVLAKLTRVRTAPVPLAGARAPVRATVLVLDPPGALAVEPANARVLVPVTHGG